MSLSESITIMPDTTSTPDTATAPAATTDSTTQPATTPATAEASAQARSPFNKAQLEEMSKAERIFNTALTDPYMAVCIKREIPEAKVQGYIARILAARNQTAAAGASANAVGGITLTEAQAEQELLTDIRTVQAAAKQKYARTNPEVLETFAVGTDVTQSRPMMEQASQSLINKVNNDDLPGLNTQFATKMSGSRKTYVDVNVAQGAQEVQAQQDRIKRDDFINEIKDARIEIQYAIDAEYPPTKAENAAVRRLFDLPANRPFNAIKRKSA